MDYFKRVLPGRLSFPHLVGFRVYGLGFRGYIYDNRRKIGTLNRELEEYSSSLMRIYLPGSLCSYYKATLLLRFPLFCGSHESLCI